MSETKNKKGNDDLRANPKWICAEDFIPRPLNISGLPRMELARLKESRVQFLVVYNPETREFVRVDNSKKYGSGALEIRIVEIV